MERMPTIDDGAPRRAVTAAGAPAWRTKACLFLATAFGILIVVDVAEPVTTAAKGLFFVFAVLSLFFVARSDGER